jgi:hypothetical protein
MRTSPSSLASAGLDFDDKLCDSALASADIPVGSTHHKLKQNIMLCLE